MTFFKTFVLANKGAVHKYRPLFRTSKTQYPSSNSVLIEKNQYFIRKLNSTINERFCMKTTGFFDSSSSSSWRTIIAINLFALRAAKGIDRILRITFLTGLLQFRPILVTYPQIKKNKIGKLKNLENRKYRKLEKIGKLSHTNPEIRKGRKDLFRVLYELKWIYQSIINPSYFPLSLEQPCKKPKNICGH